MAEKTKKAVKVRDLKPSQDAKGGAGRVNAGTQSSKANLSGVNLNGTTRSGLGRDKLN